jgi:hypothetical protein
MPKGGIKLFISKNISLFLLFISFIIYPYEEHLCKDIILKLLKRRYII